MAALTVQAALAMIALNRCVPPSVAPVMVGIAQHESGLRDTAIHDNTTGRSYFPATSEEAITLSSTLMASGHSLDLGIAQINTANFGWLGLTITTAFDACRSFKAGSAVLFAKYNGSPPDAVRKAYAVDVSAQIAGVDRVNAAFPIPAPTQSATQEEAVINDRPAEPTGETDFTGD
jgi:type IV secretion system protein VirB1